MFKESKGYERKGAPLAADGKSPRARHPWLWFVALYGGGIVSVTIVAAILHVLVFAAK
jgi:hypothetical protein